MFITYFCFIKHELCVLNEVMFNDVFLFIVVRVLLKVQKRLKTIS
jgi:hypothetical protein